MSTRADNIRKTRRFYYTEISGCCLYCDDRAEVLDHFMPIVKLANMVDSLPKELEGKIPIVSSCFSCNAIAGARVFQTVKAKRKFISARLKKKYAYLLKAQDWTDEELRELGYNIREAALEAIRTKKWLVERLFVLDHR